MVSNAPAGLPKFPVDHSSLVGSSCCRGFRSVAFLSALGFWFSEGLVVDPGSALLGGAGLVA